MKSLLFLLCLSFINNCYSQSAASPLVLSNISEFMDINYKVNGSTHINIYITVNTVSNSIYFMKRGSKSFSVPGATYAIRGTHAAALSGGGSDGAVDACLILFGKSRITTQKEPENGFSISAENVYPKASHLTVQQIAVRIECDNALMDAVLKEIDFKKLEGMIGH